MRAVELGDRPGTAGNSRDVLTLRRLFFSPQGLGAWRRFHFAATPRNPAVGGLSRPHAVTPLLGSPWRLPRITPCFLQLRRSIAKVLAWGCSSTYTRGAATIRVRVRVPAP